MAEPLAERLRPRILDDYVGQQHLVGEGAVLRKMIDAKRISSFILSQNASRRLSFGDRPEWGRPPWLKSLPTSWKCRFLHYPQ